MSKDEVAVMICSPVKDGPARVIESTTRSCMVCNTPVWVSPNSAKIMEEKGATPVCIPCYVDVVEPTARAMPDGIKMATINQAQEAEIKSLLGEDQNWEMYKRLARSLGFTFESDETH